MKDFNFCRYCGKRIEPEQTRFSVDGEPYGTECEDEEAEAQGFDMVNW